MRIFALRIELKGAIISLRDDGSIDIPFGYRFQIPELEMVLNEAKAFKKYLQSRKNPQMKLKGHKYEFDVPLKPELVWCEWKPEIRRKCKICGTHLQIYTDVLRYYLICSNCKYKIHLDW